MASRNQLYGLGAIGAFAYFLNSQKKRAEQDPSYTFKLKGVTVEDAFDNWDSTKEHHSAYSWTNNDTTVTAHTKGHNPSISMKLLISVSYEYGGNAQVPMYSDIAVSSNVDGAFSINIPAQAMRSILSPVSSVGRVNQLNMTLQFTGPGLSTGHSYRFAVLPSP